MVKRLGVTCRVDCAVGYTEWRDGLAQDWGRLLRQFPTLAWMPVPNLGAQATLALAQAWDLEALILSGGNDLQGYGGSSRGERDESELALLDWARREAIPVLGVCRGLQLMVHQAGGRLERREGHVATSHGVAVDAAELGVKPGSYRVNSYHSWGVRDCPDALQVWARDEQGWVEAVRGESVWGVMWHPEREGVDSELGPGLIARWLAS